MSKARINSRAAIKGHPLHPALIHFPIAALLLLIVTDIVFVFTDDPFWAGASFWLAAVGLAGGIVASLPGAIDVFSMRLIRRIVAAWAHGVLAIMMLSLATLNLMLRLGDDPGALIMPWGLYISILAGIMINVAGSLGAQLVFEYGVGMDIPQEEERRVKP
ncbi:DUF2231 domain-containing protein [Alteromonas pelagimontana]|uniref:DUF2231 domain-containing protein n=1 Tax=Alteromonas pelagimontana TaxID=1858656 RepID=A0A6M4MJ24_9ALTE|nr:DUF2231 domain-containing protein [Alteromonas pelagimontana]QJR82635.1 DUF2231 domain-containing protein [Alteromonas pelagimontana]